MTTTLPPPRIPDHAFIREVCRLCAGSPLALTSANLSGQPDPRTAQETEALSADLTLDSGPTAEQAIPSTVIKIDHQTISLLREGALPFSTLETRFHEGISS